MGNKICSPWYSEHSAVDMPHYIDTRRLPHTKQTPLERKCASSESHRNNPTQMVERVYCAYEIKWQVPPLTLRFR